MLLSPDFILDVLQNNGTKQFLNLVVFPIVSSQPCSYHNLHVNLGYHSTLRNTWSTRFRTIKIILILETECLASNIFIVYTFLACFSFLTLSLVIVKFLNEYGCRRLCTLEFFQQPHILKNLTGLAFSKI